MAEPPYSRVYWTIIDDPKFATIYDNDRHLATWLRLLLIADQANPASAHVPEGVSRPSLKALVESGLVDLSKGKARYVIHGLKAERERRAERGRNAANARWNADALDPAMQTHMPSDARQDETRRDEHRQVETSSTHALLPLTDGYNGRETNDGRTDLEAFLVITRRAPTAKQRRLLDDVLDRHDLTGPAWAADIMYRHPADPIGAVIEADTAYRAERIAAAQAAEKPKPQPRRSPGLPETTREIMAEMAILNRETA